MCNPNRTLELWHSLDLDGRTGHRLLCRHDPVLPFDIYKGRTIGPKGGLKEIDDRRPCRRRRRLDRDLPLTAGSIVYLTAKMSPRMFFAACAVGTLTRFSVTPSVPGAPFSSG
jgi:hypothetical protein